MSAEPEPPYPFDPDALDLLDLEAEDPAAAEPQKPPPARPAPRARPRRVEAGPGLDPDAPNAEREPPAVRKIGFEPADAFLARLEASTEPEWIVKDLIPFDGVAMWHGRPRSMKSLAALELNLALATGTQPFGSDRFEIPPCDGSFLYLTEEDGERMLGARLRLKVAGRDLDRAPSRLRIVSRPGWNLERTDDQAAILDAIREVTPAPIMLTIDPTRGSAPSVDKGPSEGAPVVRFIRQLLRQTSIRALLLVAHDVKPARDGKDDRVRAERSSGGVLFSIADCPVHFERVDDRSCVAVPSLFKVGADPKPFRILFESGTPAGEPFRGFLRAQAATTDERAETVSRVEAAVLRVLEEATDWMPTAALLEAVTTGKRQEQLAALNRLKDTGRATERPAGRGGRGREWRKALNA